VFARGFRTSKRVGVFSEVTAYSHSMVPGGFEEMS